MPEVCSCSRHSAAVKHRCLCYIGTA